MTGGGPQYKTETLVGYIYNRGFQTAPYDLGYASAIAVYLFLIIALITFVMRKYAFGQGGANE
jgi:multiple sugar transport system permease protein